MKITIFGAGYVGLSTAVCLATKFEVSLVDIDANKINAIHKGQPLIYEEGLDELLENGLKSGRLKVFHLHGTIPAANIIFITVGTPSDPDGYINLSFVRDVTKTLRQRKNELLHPEYSLVVIRSTVIPGTTTRVLGRLEEKKRVGIAFNPEFLSQGSAIANTFNPSRLIIGANDSQAANYLETFYKTFYADVKPPLLKMSIESAEFAKYAANALLATKISFANELANIVESFPEANIDDVMNAVGLDPRISPQFLRAGIGFGGSCFPKDLRALVQFAQDLHAEKPILLNAVLQVNENRPLKIIQLLRNELGNLTERKIAVLGLAFKPGTNDTRETPALSVIRSLWRNGASIHVHDPLLARIDIRPFNRYQIQTCTSIRSCVTGADACIILTEWPEYKSLELPELTEQMRTKLIIDGRRIFSQRLIPEDVKYRTIGNHSNHSKMLQEDPIEVSDSHLYQK